MHGPDGEKGRARRAGPIHNSVLEKCPSGLNLLPLIGLSLLPFTLSGLNLLPSLAPRPSQVVITEPCPDPSAPTFCKGPTGGFFCSATKCAQARKMLMLGMPTSMPGISLLPQNTSTVYVEVGGVPAFSLAPCPSGTAPPSRCVRGGTVLLKI